MSAVTLQRLAVTVKLTGMYLAAEERGRFRGADREDLHKVFSRNVADDAAGAAAIQGKRLAGGQERRLCGNVTHAITARLRILAALADAGNWWRPACAGILAVSFRRSCA